MTEQQKINAKSIGLLEQFGGRLRSKPGSRA